MWILTSSLHNSLRHSFEMVYFWQTDMHVAKRQLFQPAADSLTSFLLPYYDSDLNDGLKHVEKECLLSHNDNFILFIAVFFSVQLRERVWST